MEKGIENTFKTVKELESYIKKVKDLTHWDYTNAGEFKEVIEKVGKGTFDEAFINDIHGKRSVSATGLRYLSHYKKIKELTTEITHLEFDKSGNPNFVMFKATVVGYDYSPSENRIVEVKYVSHSDATPGNVTKSMKDSFIRIGETRAINRALINYLNVDMNSSEELYSDIGPHIIEQENLDKVISISKKLDKSEKDLLVMFNKQNSKEGFDEVNEITEVYHDVAMQVYQRLGKKYKAIGYLSKLAKKYEVDNNLIIEKVKEDYGKDSVKKINIRQIEELTNYFKEKVKEESA